MRYSSLLSFRLSTMFVVTAVIAVLVAVNFRRYDIPWDSELTREHWKIFLHVSPEAPKICIGCGWPWSFQEIYVVDIGEDEKFHYVKSLPGIKLADIAVAVAIVILSGVISEFAPRRLFTGRE